MSKNKPTTIIRKIDIPKPQLWFIWIILFLFPSIFSIICFQYFQKEYLYFLKTDLISSSFDKLKKYNEAITPENFLKNQLELIKNIDTNQTAEALKAYIDNKLCCETLLCMFFDENYNNAVIVKSPKASISSTNFLKTSIINYLKTTSTNTNEKVIKEAQSQLASRLQIMFKTTTPITIDFDEVAINFSAINDGDLYFFLLKFHNSKREYSSLFSVIRGKDFSFHKMLEELHKDFPNARIVFKEIDINKNLEEELSQDVKPAFYSGLKQNKESLFILAPVNPRTTRHILHSGSADLNLKYGYLFPYIEYHIPLAEGFKSLKQIEKNIKYIALFIIIISAIYFLHINLFGLNPKWKFKSKIIALTIISAIIPFTIFILGNYSLNELNRLISKISIEQHIDARLQIISSELDNYLTKIEKDLNKYSKELANHLAKPDLRAEEFSELMSQIGDNIPLSKELILLKSVPDNLKTLLSKEDNLLITKSFSKRISDVVADEEKQAFLTQIPYNVLKYALEEKIQDRKPRDNFIIAGKTVESTEINESLMNTGELIQMFDKATVSWYNISLIEKKDSQEILGVFGSTFEPKPILNSFLEKTKLSKKEVKDNYEINYAFLPVEKSGNAEIWSSSSENISPQNKEICLKNPQTKKYYLANEIIITKLNQRVPHLAVAIVKELSHYNEKDFIIKTIIDTLLYLLLIVFFANKLLDIIFVEPVMKLASNANSIAKGGDEWYTEIKSGDEFESLNNKFKNLVTGLKARNILKSYVSEDAFSDIEESENLKLSPGGEYVEATIVFSALKDYDKFSQQITPQESIRLLSRFMSIAEEVTKKYGGSIDKIIGDTIMLVFRHNPDQVSHGLRAAQASLELVDKAKFANMPELYTGIASGKVISGRIGSYSGKLDFTVIGNPVNLAARFKTESKNGTEKTGIIISGTTIRLTKGKAIVRFLRRVSVKGKAHQYNIYELLGIRE